MKIIKILTLFTVLFQLLYAQSQLPKREFRGVWIATVANLDWPRSRTASSDVQKLELINMLDELRKSGFNAVIFQVRPECDAFYNSAYEPWSYYLTGYQGHGPNPYYDPLQFAIEEAHKRGMELHAWFNPYRAVRSVGSYTINSSHVSVQHPEWIITKGDFKSLDPGLPMVREYVTGVIMDVVENYDIDGVHFDDYFYPEGMTNSDDQATFDAYPNGFTNRGDWRRNNVNLLVEMVHEAILDSKPNIKFGISPAGIWKSGTPPGIIGRSAYSAIYCDAIAWLNALTIDYINPQCYWEFGGDQDYGKLISWWASEANGRHVYSGNAGYRIDDFSADELPRQIRYNRDVANIEGSVNFRALNGVLDNQRGFNDSLRTDLFRYPALIPQMDWKDLDPPNSPQNLRYAFLDEENSVSLKWDVPEIAADGDSARRYVVYRFDNDHISESDLEDSKNIVSIEGNTYSVPQEPADSGPYYYVLTALDQNWNESGMGEIIQINSPQQPFLLAPNNGSSAERDTVVICWNANRQVSSYYLQIAEQADFMGEIFVEQDKLTDTSYTFTDMDGQKTYYWRVLAKNAGGTGDFSEIFAFTTGFPAQAQLLYPEHKSTKIDRTPTLIWASQQEAQTYHLQVAVSNDFSAEKIVVDTTALTDTSITVGPLQATKYHYWRIQAENEYGKGLWSDSFRFKTSDLTPIGDEAVLPLSLKLKQNYPNPFNLQTTIPFTLDKESQVYLTIYNIQGKIVERLLHKKLKTGHYSLKFDCSHLASGVYIYELRTEQCSLKRKMTLIK